MPIDEGRDILRSGVGSFWLDFIALLLFMKVGTGLGFVCTVLFVIFDTENCLSNPAPLLDGFVGDRDCKEDMWAEFFLFKIVPEDIVLTLLISI